MKKAMFLIAVTSFVAMALFAALYYKFSFMWLFSLAITAGMFFYHMAVRLLIGYGVNFALKGRVNVNAPLFQKKDFEDGLYKLVKVKQWKGHMPTFEAGNFSMSLCTEQIIENSCIAEVVHIVCAVFSILAIWFYKIFGAFYVFLITSVFGAVFDLMFVIMQRFNRPRLIRLLKKQKAN